MWVQLSTTCSNLLKLPNGELLVAVDHNQLRTMRASETVDPIDWSHPYPTQGSTPWAPRVAQCNAGCKSHKTCCTHWAANVRPLECQANALPVRPLKVILLLLLILLLLSCLVNGTLQTIIITIIVSCLIRAASAKTIFRIAKKSSTIPYGYRKCELMHVCCPQHLSMDTARMNQEQITEEGDNIQLYTWKEVQRTRKIKVKT